MTQMSLSTSSRGPLSISMIDRFEAFKMASVPTLDVLYRFEEGKLERRILNMGSTIYVMISHVWGGAEWQEIQ